MELKYEDMEEMCQTLGDKIAEANDKLRATNNELTGGDLSYIDSLTHALKSLKTIMAMDEGYSRDSGYSGDYPGRYYGGGNSYARRGRNGRYSRRGYSRGEDDVAEQLREVMENATDERAKREIQKLITKMEG